MADPNPTDVITVAIPTFNRHKLLERAVQSVLDERRIPIRLQVHDNQSTDGTEDFMRELAAKDNRVSYVRNAANVGCLPNITLSFDAVRTAYFVPLADDDYFLPGFLFDAHAIMRDDAELGAVAFYAESRDHEGRLVSTWPNDVGRMPQGKLRPGSHLREWMTSSHYSWQAVLWRTGVLKDVGAPYMHTGLSSDVDFQAQVFVRHPVFVVKRPGAVFSVHEEQASNGHSVAEVASWAKLFSRLDKAVERLHVLAPEEYLEARQVMWRRMRPSWTRTSATPLSMSRLARTAVIAGFRLGDWELAFHLLNEVKARQARPDPTTTTDLSSSSGSATRQAGDRIGDLTDLGLRTLAMLQGSVLREHAMNAQLEKLMADVKMLQNAALSVAAERNRLAAELAALRLQEASTSEHVASGDRASHPLRDESRDAFAPDLVAAV